MGVHVDEYDPYFEVGKKSQKQRAHQYINGLFCAERGKMNIERMVFKTKPELGLEMVEELINNGVHFDYINGDGLYGNSYTFSKGLDSLGVRYVLDVHSTKDFFTATKHKGS